MRLKAAFFSGLFLFFHSSSLRALQPDDYIFHYQIEVPTPQDVEDYLTSVDRAKFYGSHENAVALYEIVNMATKIWRVIKENQPVLNVQSVFANALPKGVSPGELEGFSDFQHRSFRRFGTNAFGMTVYDLTYTLAHRYGGSYEGRGKYLEGVSVIPSKVEVAWGYTLDFAVTQISTVNVSTKENPTASLGMELGLGVSTVMKKSQYRSLFQFRGDNSQVQIVK